jgi:Flp pilus assembly protein TadD
VVVRVPLVLVACLLLLAGCMTMPLGNSAATDGSAPSADAYAPTSPPEETPPAAGEATPAPGLAGSDPNDDLSLAKKAFRTANYGLAEQHFRKTIETHPKDGEAWVGLAAANDRLKRFDLADRAYKEAIAILGPTPEILNNQGFSYMLRGDYGRARQTLRKAQAADPRNPYILNNINLLEQVARKGKGIQ